MSTNTFNLGDLFGGTDFNECPTGEATVEVVEANANPAKSGKPMVSIKCRIVGGPFAGRIVRDNIVLTVDSPDSLPFFYAKIAAFGASDPELLKQCVGTLKPIAQAVVGKRAEVVLKEDTYNGVTRPKIAEYKGPAEDGYGELSASPAAFQDFGDDEVAF